MVKNPSSKNKQQQQQLLQNKEKHVCNYPTTYKNNQQKAKKKPNKKKHYHHHQHVQVGEEFHKYVKAYTEGLSEEQLEYMILDRTKYIGGDINNRKTGTVGKMTKKLVIH